MAITSFKIDDYKAKFTGGAKQYLFFTHFQFPKAIGQTDRIPYMVRSTSLPDSTFEEIAIPYPGLTFKMAGTRSYGDWSISFNVDNKGILLKNFHMWHDVIYSGNAHTQESFGSYRADQQLFLLDGFGKRTHEITLISAWPKSISAIGLDYASTDIATMDVTFSYQYFISNPYPKE